MWYLDEFLAWLVEQRVRLRSAFHCSWLAHSGTVADHPGRHRFDQETHLVPPLARLDVAQPQFDLPAPCIETVKLDAVVQGRIGEGCHHGQRAATTRAVLEIQADQPHFQRGGQGFPCLVRQLSLESRKGGATPDHQPLVARDLASLAPVERGIALLMEAHGDVAAFCKDRGNVGIGTEGAVGQKQITLADVIEQAFREREVMFGECPGGHGFPAAVAEVEQCRDAHDREPAAGLLPLRLGETLLILFRVGELRGRAVKRLEDEAMAQIGLLRAPRQGLANPMSALAEEGVRQPAPRLAVGTGVAGRNWQTLGAAPALDEPDCLRPRSVPLKNLGYPSPEYRDVAEVAVASGGIDPLEESRWQNVLEHHGVAAEGLARPANRGDASSRLETGGGRWQNVRRKVGQDGLLLHNYNYRTSAGFPSPVSPEKRLSPVSIGTDLF